MRAKPPVRPRIVAIELFKVQVNFSKSRLLSIVTAARTPSLELESLKPTEEDFTISKAESRVVSSRNCLRRFLSIVMDVYLTLK